MATGDVYCPTHGYSACQCYYYNKQTDWTYTSIKNTGGTASDWLDYDYNDYVYQQQNYLAVPVYKTHPHDRWSRMRMMVDEDWECLKGIIELSHYDYPQVEYKQKTQGYWPSKSTGMKWSYTSTTTSDGYDPYANYSDNKLYIYKDNK
jgi:hypothetical protein